MTKKFRELEKITSKFVENKFLFPGCWSGEIIIDDGIAFVSYFNEARDYFDLVFRFPEYKISLTKQSGKFLVQHPLGVGVSEKKLAKLLRKVLEYYEQYSDEEKRKMLEKINDTRKRIGNMKEELNRLVGAYKILKGDTS